MIGKYSPSYYTLVMCAVLDLMIQLILFVCGLAWNNTKATKTSLLSGIDDRMNMKFNAQSQRSELLHIEYV